MTSNATAVPQRQPVRSLNARSLAIVLPLLLVPLLSSCRHGMPRTAEIPPALLVLVNPLPPIGADLTAACPAELPPAIDPSLAGLGRNHLQAAAIYHDCKDRNARLASAARERERLELERIERARQALERPLR